MRLIHWQFRVTVSSPLWSSDLSVWSFSFCWTSDWSCRNASGSRWFFSIASIDSQRTTCIWSVWLSEICGCASKERWVSIWTMWMIKLSVFVDVTGGLYRLFGFRLLLSRRYQMRIGWATKKACPLLRSFSKVWLREWPQLSLASKSWLFACVCSDWAWRISRRLSLVTLCFEGCCYCSVWLWRCAGVLDAKLDAGMMSSHAGS